MPARQWLAKARQRPEFIWAASAASSWPGRRAGARAEQFHPVAERDRLGPVGCFDLGAQVQAPSAAQLATLWSAQPADFVPTLTSLRPGTVRRPPASPQVRGVASRGSFSSQVGVLAARNTTIGR